MKRGLLIVLDGPDGSGKSTLIQGLIRYYQRERRPFIAVREPGGTALGEALRHELLQGEYAISARAEALIFAAARAQLVEEVIQPALAEGKDVLCDRYILSSLAYQGVGRELGMDPVAKINEFATEDLYPDLTLYLHLDPEEGLRRQARMRSFDRMEDEGLRFHIKVGEAYELAMHRHPEHHIWRIDASQAPDQVLDQAIYALQSLFEKEGSHAETE